MSEDLVKAVLTAYFIKKGIDAHPTERGEKGPDFHINGEVVEVKGTSFDDEGLMRQLITYAFREREVTVALPADAFTAKILVKLYILSGVLNEIKSKSLKLLLVSRHGDFYHVKEFSDVRNLIPQGLSHFKTVAIFAILVDKPFGLKGKPSEVEAKRVSENLARTVQKVDIAIEQLLIQASTEEPVVKILKASVKVPRLHREEKGFWEL